MLIIYRAFAILNTPINANCVTVFVRGIVGALGDVQALAVGSYVVALVAKDIAKATVRVCLFGGFGNLPTAIVIY